jgi:hypothetical protein
MNDTLALQIPKLDTVRVELSPPDSIKLAGAVKDREAIAQLTAFFRAVHTHALEVRQMELRIDVSELTFVSAAGFRLFVDWAAWVKVEKYRPYRLHFLSSRWVGWQKTSLPALAALATDILDVQRID